MKQVAYNIGACAHLDIEEVKSEAGTVIANRCVGCTKITCHVGLCDGMCSRVTKNLTHFSSRKRYCTEECCRSTRKEKKKQEEQR